MKNIFILLTVVLISVSCRSQATMKTLGDAKKLETNKNEFVGKSLNYFLDHINVDIKSIVPTPNKNRNEVNRISFLLVPYNEYRNSKKDVTEKPTRITLIFNQNADLVGERCRYDIPGCIEWTKEDKKNLGSLLIYDIYVLGKD